MHQRCAAPARRAKILIKMVITVPPFLAPPPSRSALLLVYGLDLLITKKKLVEFNIHKLWNSYLIFNQ